MTKNININQINQEQFIFLKLPYQLQHILCLTSKIQMLQWSWQVK